MSGVRKYAGLPDLDAAPDIYETPNLTDDTSTHPTSTTLRSDSPVSSYHDDDEEVDGIDRHRIDVDEARTHFLPSGERDPGISSRISSKRKSYRSSSRRRRKDGQEINGVELNSDDEKESLERKIARLRKEVAEVKGEYERRRLGTDDGTAETPVKNDESLDGLSQVLDSVNSKAPEGEHGAAERLAKRLVSLSKSSERDGQASQSTQNNTDGSTCTITYAPAYQENHTLSKVSDFDTRLTLIEAALGIDAIPLPTQDRSPAKALLPTLDTLDKQLTALSTSTDSSLDGISRRVRQLTQDAENLDQARRSAKAAQEALTPNTTPVPANPNSSTTPSITTTDNDAEQTSKINALYGTLPTIESLAPLLPSVLDRLRSLRALHADAATASQTLAKMESQQEAVSEELRGWRHGLEKVEAAMAQGELSLKGNTQVVERWVRELEGRMKTLGGANLA